MAAGRVFAAGDGDLCGRAFSMRNSAWNIIKQPLLSSVGRAWDCNRFSGIPRSLVRSRKKGMGPSKQSKSFVVEEEGGAIYFGSFKKGFRTLFFAPNTVETLECMADLLKRPAVTLW
jgi:hypothetical protein